MEKTKLSNCEERTILDYNVQSLLDMTKSRIKAKMDELGLVDGCGHVTVTEYDNEMTVQVIGKHSHDLFFKVLAKPACSNPGLWVFRIYHIDKHAQFPSPSIMQTYEKYFCSETTNIDQMFGSLCVSAGLRLKMDDICFAGPNRFSGEWHYVKFLNEMSRIFASVSNCIMVS